MLLATRPPVHLQRAGLCWQLCALPIYCVVLPWYAHGNLDVTQSSASHPARWIDLRLLQLADTLIFSGSSVAVYGFAAAVHRQHIANGCGALLRWEHFKRQLGEAIMVSASMISAADGGAGEGWGGEAVVVQQMSFCCK